LLGEAEAAEANRIGFISFPIPDRGVPASAAAASLIASISNALEDGKNPAVHCRQGIGRPGLIAAAVLASSRIDPQEGDGDRQFCPWTKCSGDL
jgi:protein-tyrosine phosphatase